MAFQVPIPAPLRDACNAMLVLEELRDPCIRGDRAITPQIVAAVENAYRNCTRLTESIISN